MADHSDPSFLLFEDHRCLRQGSADAVAVLLQQRFADPSRGQLLVFDAASGLQLDVDHSLDSSALARQLESIWTRRCAPLSAGDAAAAKAKPRGPGRPKLGVVSREITLLPRHWAWLNAQPGGASVTLRKLVEQARKTDGGKDQIRQAQDRAYRFIHTLAGNLAGFEESCRALYAGDRERFIELTEPWPADLRDHARRLAEPALGSELSAD